MFGYGGLGTLGGNTFGDDDIPEIPLPSGIPDPPLVLVPDPDPAQDPGSTPFPTTPTIPVTPQGVPSFQIPGIPQQPIPIPGLTMPGVQQMSVPPASAPAGAKPSGVTLGQALPWLAGGVLAVGLLAFAATGHKRPAPPTTSAPRYAANRRRRRRRARR